MKKLIFDVGATAIKYALMDNDATIYEKGKEDTPHDTFEHFLDIIQSLYEKYKDEIDGMSFSLPGTIDSSTGQIYAPGGLFYNENVNLVNEIHKFTNIPVYLENDGKSAALAEVWKGNLQDCQDGIVIILGTGIGGGIVKDRKLWKGKHLFAGEFSYLLQNDSQSFMQSAWAMQASTTALILNTAQSKQVDPQSLNGYQVFEMIHQGDEDAINALHLVTNSLARGIFNLQCILDPEKILIGGGISQQEILIDKIQEELDKIYATLPFDIPRVQLDTCRFYNDSNLIGALYHYLMEEK